MTNEFADSIRRGLKEAIAFADGTAVSSRFRVRARGACRSCTRATPPSSILPPAWRGEEE